MLARNKSRVMVVVNSDAAVSQQAADLYCEMRGIDRRRQWRYPMGDSIYWDQPEDGFAWVPFVSKLAAAAKEMTASCVLFSAATPLYYSGGIGAGVALAGMPSRMFMALTTANPETAGYQHAASADGGNNGKFRAWRASAGGGLLNQHSMLSRGVAWHRVARHVGLPSGRIGMPSYSNATLSTERLEDVRRVVADAMSNELTIEHHMHKPHLFGVSTRTKGSAGARGEFVAAGAVEDCLRWFEGGYTASTTPPEQYKIAQSFGDVFNGRVDPPIPFFVLAGGSLTNPWGRKIEENYIRSVSSIELFTEDAGGELRFWYEVETTEPHDAVIGRRVSMSGVTFPSLNTTDYPPSSPQVYAAGDLIGLMAPAASISATRWRGAKTVTTGGLGPGQDIAAWGDVSLNGATVRRFDRSVEFSGLYDKSLRPLPGAWVYENTSFSHMVGQDMLHKGACLYVGAVIEPFGSQVDTSEFCRAMLMGLTAAEALFLCGGSHLHAAVGDPLYAPYMQSARTASASLYTDQSGSGGYASYGGPLSDFGGDNPFNCDWP